MCRQPDSDNQNSIFRSFIRESVRELKSTGRVYVFFRYQIEEIKKSFPHDIISIIPVDNYYILNLIRGKEVK